MEPFITGLLVYLGIKAMGGGNKGPKIKGKFCPSCNCLLQYYGKPGYQHYTCTNPRCSRTEISPRGAVDGYYYNK